MIVNGLTTLANAKLIAGVEGTTYDATLELLINRVSGIVRQYLGRQLTRATYTEKLSATSRQLLILSEWPIVSVISLKSRDETLEQDVDYRLDAQDKVAGMIYKEDGWTPINLVSGLTMDVMAAARTIDVTYVAGYYLPADEYYIEGSGDSLPLEISGIVDEMVVARFLKIKLGTQGLTSYSEGGISYGWQTHLGSVMMGLSDEQAMALNAYKRFVVA